MNNALEHVDFAEWGCCLHGHFEWHRLLTNRRFCTIDDTFNLYSRLSPSRDANVVGLCPSVSVLNKKAFSCMYAKRQFACYFISCFYFHHDTDGMDGMDGMCIAKGLNSLTVNPSDAFAT